MLWILPVSRHLVNCDFASSLGPKNWGYPRGLGWNEVVAMPIRLDVHYLGLELSDLSQFHVGGSR
jgi:hypothetical protein